eukprot:TRINITY_DN5547_c0_g2_i2.p1 TRINITY_DN5547_c0_g2~~TRINITY_DN5547_c0_g2_i2.p1  ORF type:complete len:739 (+),score=118.83 TRINITY_DN5547_c0_g2_i2:64-2280(+)
MFVRRILAGVRAVIVREASIFKTKPDLNLPAVEKLDLVRGSDEAKTKNQWVFARTEDVLQEHGHPILVREQARKLVRKCLARAAGTGYGGGLITGGSGCGKSNMLAFVAVELWQMGWKVMYISNARLLSEHQVADIRQLAQEYEATNGPVTDLEIGSVQNPADFVIYDKLRGLTKRTKRTAQDIVDALKANEIENLDTAQLLAFKRRALVDLIVAQQAQQTSVLAVDCWNTIHADKVAGRNLSPLAKLLSTWKQSAIVGKGCLIAATIARFAEDVYHRAFTDGQVATDVDPYITKAFTPEEEKLVLQHVYPQLWQRLGFAEPVETTERMSKQDVVAVKAHNDEVATMSQAGKDAANAEANARLVEFRQSFGCVGRQIRGAVEQGAGGDWQEFMSGAIERGAAHWVTRILAVCRELMRDSNMVGAHASDAEPISPEFAKAFAAVVDGGTLVDPQLALRMQALGAFDAQDRPASQTVLLACRRLVLRQINALTAFFLEKGDDSSSGALLGMFLFDQSRNVELPLCSMAGEKSPEKRSLNIIRVQTLPNNQSVKLEEGIMYRLAQRHPAIDMLFVHKLDPVNYRLLVFQASLSLYDNMSDIALQERAPDLYMSLKSVRAAATGKSIDDTFDVVTGGVHPSNYDNLKHGAAFEFLQGCVKETFPTADVSPAALMKHVEYFYVSPRAMPFLKHGGCRPRREVASRANRWAGKRQIQEQGRPGEGSACFLSIETSKNRQRIMDE